MPRPLVNILLTCSNSQVMPSIVAMVKDHPLYDIRVFGCDSVDANENLSKNFCSKCFKVPLGNDTEYIPAITEIIEKHKIHLIFVGSDEECHKLSENRKILAILGCQIACSDFAVVALSSNKLILIREIARLGMGLGDVFQPNSFLELGEYAKRLGYPRESFVFKPISGRGSKGFKLVSSKFSTYDAFLNNRHYAVSLEDLKYLFKNHEDQLKNYLMMTNYSGEKYSIDALVSKGRVKSMVIRNNGTEVKNNPPTQKAELVFDSDIRHYASQLIEKLGFDYFAQIEVGRSMTGEIGLIEINTRLDATLPITSGLGLNYFHEMTTYAMEGKFRKDLTDPEDYGKRIRFRRYWSHLFEEINS